MSHEPGGPKSYHQEPVGSMPACLTFMLNRIFPNSNHIEPVNSTSDHIKLLPNKIRQIGTQNKITAPFNNNTHKIDIVQKCNGLHRKYVDITENI